MSTFRQKLSTGSSSSSSSGSSTSGSDSESASSHSSTQSDESTHEAENKLATQNNNHLPSFSDTSDEEEPPKRRKLPEARYAQTSTAARAASATSTHSKRNTSPAPSLASTSSRRNGYSRAPSTSRPPSASQPSTSTSNNLMSIFNASRASSSLSIKSPELSAGGSSESKSSSSSSENDAPVFGTVSSTQQANFSQVNGKKATRKAANNKKCNSELESTVETPATALERMVIDEEMLNDIKIEIKSEDEEFEPNKVEIKAVKKAHRKTSKRPATKQQSSSSSSSSTSSSSSESEYSEAGAAQNSQKRQTGKETTNDSNKNNNIDALFDELKKTTGSEIPTANDTAEAAEHKKSARNLKSNGKAQLNGTRKRARPPESSEKSEYSTDSDDSDLAPLMTRADAEVATKVFGKRLSTQQSTENGPCLRATRSRRNSDKTQLPNGKRASEESGSESTASTHDSSASKSSSATGSASDSGSASVSPTGSDSESSSHTSCSSCPTADSSLPEVRKAVRGKRAQNSNSSSIAQNDTPRKLTRSRRRLQQQVDTDSDSDQALNGAERFLNGGAPVNGNTAGIAKRPLGLNGKSRGFLNSLLRESPPICISPPCVQEKMCPIEGCDSKGHLGGTRDRHFLPEACPLYHNMTSEECVQLLIERRKHAENFHLPVKPDEDEQEDSYGAKRVRTTAQKELWDRIHQSWRDFEQNPPQPKPQPECEEGNEQREQDLTGMAPEYDLELFRRAQAIAAEAIEDEVADCPVGKGIK